ncbi:MAG: copper chaperone PCu(A)C [Gemmatimonadota bacterium]
MRPATAVRNAASVMLVAVLLVPGGGCHRGVTGPAPVVEGAWVRAVKMPLTPLPNGVNSAAYMTLRNRGTVAARLVGASCPDADSVQIHESRIENGVASMRPVAGLDVPPGGAVRFAPGSYHLMLLDVHRSLAQGDTVNITLHFAAAPDIKMQVPVQ